MMNCDESGNALESGEFRPTYQGILSRPLDLGYRQVEPNQVLNQTTLKSYEELQRLGTQQGIDQMIQQNRASARDNVFAKAAAAEVDLQASIILKRLPQRDNNQETAMNNVNTQLINDKAVVGDRYRDPVRYWRVESGRYGLELHTENPVYDGKALAIDGHFTKIVAIPNLTRVTRVKKLVKMAPALMKSGTQVKVSDHLFASEQAAKDFVGASLFVKWLIDSTYATTVEVDA